MNPRHADDTVQLDGEALTAPQPRLDPPGPATPVSPDLAPVIAQTPAAVDVDLDRDPFADDLGTQLEALAPRRWAGRSTMVLAALVLVIAGFVGGAQVQKHWGTTAGGRTGNANSANRPTVSASGNPFAGRFGGFGGGAGTGAGAGTGGATGTGGTRTGGATTGTVKLVDGNTVYITTSDGQTVIVNTTGSTTVDVAQSGSLKDLQPGATVTVQGSTGGDGSVNATTITKTK